MEIQNKFTQTCVPFSHIKFSNAFWDTRLFKNTVQEKRGGNKTPPDIKRSDTDVNH